MQRKHFLRVFFRLFPPILTTPLEVNKLPSTVAFSVSCKGLIITRCGLFPDTTGRIDPNHTNLFLSEKSIKRNEKERQILRRRASEGLSELRIYANCRMHGARCHKRL